MKKRVATPFFYAALKILNFERICVALAFDFSENCLNYRRLEGEETESGGGEKLWTSNKILKIFGKNTKKKGKKRLFFATRSFIMDVFNGTASRL